MKLRTLTALASAALLTLMLALNSGAGLPPCADGDSDGVCDTSDNCVAIANPPQSDGDSDGYGEACDKDTTNDCTHTVADITAIIPTLNVIEPPDSPYDVNTDGTTTVADITTIIPVLNTPHTNGSGKACASCGTGEPTGVSAPGTCP
jgi:type II secretory pathway pseudopilin PulG